MGLDMRPMGKPKPGFENRFYQIFRIVNGLEEQKRSFIDKVLGRKKINEEELLEEWFDIQIPAYEAIKAPKVGRDATADEWVRQQYLLSDRRQAEPQFIAHFDGFYVIPLAKELDGVPVYIAAGQDENVFRGQFLDLCIGLIGENLVNEAWETKFAPETIDYGNRLMAVADQLAIKHNLQHLKSRREPPDADEHSIEFQLHIVFSLGKWLQFYGDNGHGYEADY